MGEGAEGGENFPHQSFEVPMRKDAIAKWDNGSYGGDRCENPSDNLNDTYKQPVRFMSGIVENQHGPMDQSLPFGLDGPSDPMSYVKDGPMTITGEEEQ